MENNIIKFHSSHISNHDNEYLPIPTKKYIPQWYRDKEKYHKNEDMYELAFANINGKYVAHRRPTWKSCPALLDVFITGYYLLTPCDITFKNFNPEHVNSCNENHIHPPLEFSYDKKWQQVNYENSLGKISISKSFCNFRGIEEGLPNSDQYYNFTYAWIPNYFTQVPEGYTVLYTHPLNVPDLPFQTVSGFIDSSNILVGAGIVPFYIKKNWEGIIPAGTPYAQIIPIKNETWSSQIINYSEEELANQNHKKLNEYAIGVNLTKYKEIDWLKKEYE